MSNGSLLPETAEDQHGATPGAWLGLTALQLGDVFPILANFNAGRRDLGFMA